MLMLTQLTRHHTDIYKAIVFVIDVLNFTKMVPDQKLNC